jgi:hypothetical protein
LEQQTMPTTYKLTAGTYHVDEPSCDLLAAAFTATDWHGGIGCPLYKLQCGEWSHMTYSDYSEALTELQRCVPLCQPDDEDGYLALLSAIEAVEDVVCGWPGSSCDETAHYRAY